MPARRWMIPLLLVSVLVFVLSLRQLSDPDLGFHLKYGRWIVAHQQVPQSDHSTYTVHDHPYTDMHWLFQVALYGIFRWGGYTGISLAVSLFGMILFSLLLLRLRYSRISNPVVCWILLGSFLIIEQRIAPRPEMVTFILLAGIVWILDLHAEKQKDLLFLLPLIMLVWCNVHALYIIGLIVVTVYFLFDVLESKRIDTRFLLWVIGSFLACLINPYGIKGFAFAFGLLTRFDPNNVYNQHIQEFMPFFSQAHFFLRDYLFLLLTGTMAIFVAISWKTIRMRDVTLFALFGFLALVAIRNIPLAVIIVIPMVGRHSEQVLQKFRPLHKFTTLFGYAVILFLTAALLPRVLTNSYYISNNSFNKTGVGLNVHHLPKGASDFILKHNLGGRILNSIGFGGWLSWSLPQPVFIDSRLEVMQEELYQEVARSWKGELAALIKKYEPQIIIYNYLKYYPWTFQLKGMPDWRMIYVDGISAVFARSDYAVHLPEIRIAPPFTEKATKKSPLEIFLKGFYLPVDFHSIDQQHLFILASQMRFSCQVGTATMRAVAFFNSANLKTRQQDYAGAKTDYDSAIHLYPGYAKAFNNRGILKASIMKDYGGALADFNEAIRIDHNYPDAYLGRGTVYFILHDRAMACRDWMMAHSLGNVQAARLLELHCDR